MYYYPIKANDSRPDPQPNFHYECSGEIRLRVCVDNF